MWITKHCGKLLKRWEHQITLPVSRETCMQVKKKKTKKQKKTVITGHGMTISKLEKEYDKAVYCHSAHLTYMQSTSCEMPGLMNQKLKSRLPGEI